MDDQDDATHPSAASWAHLNLRDRRTDLEKEIASFNEGQRRRGSKKRWHDFYPDPVNDPAKE